MTQDEIVVCSSIAENSAKLAQAVDEFLARLINDAKEYLA